MQTIEIIPVYLMFLEHCLSRVTVSSWLLTSSHLMFSSGIVSTFDKNGVESLRYGSFNHSIVKNSTSARSKISGSASKFSGLGFGGSPILTYSLKSDKFIKWNFDFFLKFFERKINMLFWEQYLTSIVSNRVCEK